MKDVQCYELFGGIALKNHAFSFHLYVMLFAILRLSVFVLLCVFMLLRLSTTFV